MLRHRGGSSLSSLRQRFMENRWQIRQDPRCARMGQLLHPFPQILNEGSLLANDIAEFLAIRLWCISP